MLKIKINESNVLDGDISISWLVAQISLSTYFKVLGYDLSTKFEACIHLIKLGIKGNIYSNSFFPLERWQNGMHCRAE